MAQCTVMQIRTQTCQIYLQELYNTVWLLSILYLNKGIQTNKQTKKKTLHRSLFWQWVNIWFQMYVDTIEIIKESSCYVSAELPACTAARLHPIPFFLSFLGIHGKTGNWHSWFSGLVACRVEGAASSVHSAVERFERLPNLWLQPLQR